MKKVVLGICACSLFIVGCQSEESKTSEQVIVEYEGDNGLKDVASDVFRIIMEDNEVGLSEIENVIKDKISSSIERMEAEGSIVYKNSDEEIEIRKGVEGKIGSIEYIVNGGESSITYSLQMEEPMIRVLRKYSDLNEKMNDLSKLESTSLQKEYLEVVKEFNKNMSIQNVESIMNYKFSEENTSDILEGEKDIKMYSRSEKTEGIIVQQEDGRVVSIKYNNMPSGESVDVRNYTSEINESGDQRYSIEIYRSAVDVDAIIGIIGSVK